MWKRLGEIVVSMMVCTAIYFLYIKKTHRSPLKTSKGVDLTSEESRIFQDLVLPSDLDVTLEDIGGMEEVKAVIKELILIPNQRPDLFEGKKLNSVPRGILLHGPPGTGKTMIVKAVAKECDINFINLQWTSIESKWYGESEQYASAVFSLAKKIEPCIIFIDEIDAFMRNRGDGSEHEVTRRIKSIFLSLWDGLLSSENSKILIIGATNRIESIDPAIKRRMPRQVCVNLPNKQQRIQILQLILRGEVLDSDVDFNRLADLTDKYSGSDLKEICRVAVYVPVHELYATQTIKVQALIADKQNPRTVQMRDFEHALKTIPRTHQHLLFGYDQSE